MAPISREELKVILLACARIKQSAAMLFVTGDPQDAGNKKLVLSMKRLAEAAEQAAKIRAGRFMADNIQKELSEELFDEISMARDLLLNILQKKEEKDVIN